MLTAGATYAAYLIISSLGFVQYPWIQSVDFIVATFAWSVISKDYNMKNIL